jgi:hypothetical protein
MRKTKSYAAIILLLLFVAGIISAQTNTLRGRAVTTSGGIVTGDNYRMLFTSFGQAGAGTMSQGNYQLYLGLIRPAIIIDTFLSISGTVYFCDTTPYRPVAATKLRLTGTLIDSTWTNTAGYYIFDSLSTGNYTVTPQKTNTINDPAITPYDAALVLRYAIGQILLDSCQKIAADVSGNGQITSYDAALILQYSVGIIHHFPAGDWTFRPLNRTYTPLVSTMGNQNYAAILYGDVSCNWPSVDVFVFEPGTDNLVWGGNLPSADEEKIATNKHEFSRIKEVEAEITTNEHESARIQERISNSSIEEQLAVFPIKVTYVKDVISANIVLTYNPNEIEIKDVALGASNADYFMAWANGKGVLRIALAGARLLKGDIELARILYNELNRDDGIATPSVAYGTRSALRNDKKAPIQIQSIVINEEPITTTSDEGITGDKTARPKEFALMPNQPNPFKTQTAIRFLLPAKTKASLKIYDITGKLVKSFFTNPQPLTTSHCLIWDRTNDQNQMVTSGIYFYELKTDNFTARKKTIVLR